MKKYFGVIGFVLLAAVLVACGGPGGTTPPEETIPPPEEVETYTVSGIVTAGDKPVRAVPIIGEHEGGTAATMSDNDGIWELTGLQGETEITTDDPAYTLAAPISVSGAASGQVLLLTLKECNSGSITDETNPCVITRIQQVRDIDKYLDGFFKLGADIDASETADWNDGEGFKPIGDRFPGDVVEPFIGTLDGDGYAIEGLVIDRPNEDYIGLFAIASDTYWHEDEIGDPADPRYQAARIENIILRDFTITGKDYVGALAGEVETDLAKVFVEGGTVAGVNSVGGLVGDATNGDITQTSGTAKVSGHDDVGGLIGYWDGGQLTESFSAGTVTGITAVGGLVGFMEGEILNSFSIANITLELGSSGSAGGLAGHQDGTKIRNSFSAGTIQADAGAVIGGLIGGTSSNPTVEDSFWDDEVAQTQGAGMGTPKDTEDMFKKDTYVGWDFDDVWEIDEGNAYPNLRNNPR